MDILRLVDEERQRLVSLDHGEPAKLVTMAYYRRAEQVFGACAVRDARSKESFTNKVDRIVLHRLLGPVILVAIMYVLYYLSIVKGYQLTNYTWPLLAALRNSIARILPPEGLVFDPAIRSMVLSVVDGLLAVLNYVPIFAILFSLVAILEDVGYVPRMAFIMDRVFRRFGLHGQSVFPMVLGGVVVGGCAIPAIMATRGMKDQRARLATILIIPLLNCLAKTPLHILLIEMFYSEHRAFAIVFISTVSLVIALTVSKILSLTVLRSEESAPFVMEMPPYHAPTVSGVLQRCWERLWLFIRKIATVVLAVMIVVFALTNLPGLGAAQKQAYCAESDRMAGRLRASVGDGSHYAHILADEGLIQLVRYSNEFDLAKKAAASDARLDKVHQSFAAKNLDFYKIVNRGRYESEGTTQVDQEAARVSRAFSSFERERKALRAQARDDVIVHSTLGIVGKALEPVTRYAGFDWKINIALISSFAAKESSVATLGGIYGLDSGARLEESVAESDLGWTDLHALALMVFMVVFPPCIPTLLAVKMETGSTMWTLFAGVYPILLGLLLASLVFTGGRALGLSGIQAMTVFYVTAIIVMLALSVIRERGEEDLDEDFDA
ncbi:MAG TPA: ferrous iron transport protein B [Firmicutes bacterium]|nr:ferrous iron transport protein B [Bacillota bacterium]